MDKEEQLLPQTGDDGEHSCNPENIENFNSQNVSLFFHNHSLSLESIFTCASLSSHGLNAPLLFGVYPSAGDDDEIYMAPPPLKLLSMESAGGRKLILDAENVRVI